MSPGGGTKGIASSNISFSVSDANPETISMIAGYDGTLERVGQSTSIGGGIIGYATKEYSYTQSGIVGSIYPNYFIYNNTTYTITRLIEYIVISSAQYNGEYLADENWLMVNSSSGQYFTNIIISINGTELILTKLTDSIGNVIYTNHTTDEKISSSVYRFEKDKSYTIKIISIT